MENSTRNTVLVALAAETASKPKTAGDILCFHPTFPASLEKIFMLFLKRTKILHLAIGSSGVESKG